MKRIKRNAEIVKNKETHGGIENLGRFETSGGCQLRSLRFAQLQACMITRLRSASILSPPFRTP